MKNMMVIKQNHTHIKEMQKKSKLCNLTHSETLDYDIMLHQALKYHPRFKQAFYIHSQVHQTTKPYDKRLWKHA